MITEHPRIATARMGYEDSYTLERFLATGGYEGLRKALSMTAREGAGGGQYRQPARARRCRLSCRAQMVDATAGSDHLPRRQRRRERAGDVQGPHAHRAAIPTRSSKGAIIAAYAIGAAAAFLFCRGEFALGYERLLQACNEAYEYGALGADIFGSGFSLDLVIHPGAGAYICGDETGLLESLEGKRGFPRIKPPYFPAAIGLYGEPTIVNNVETMANLPWIILNGGAAFAALGQGSSAGTRVFALSGHVERPGLVRDRDVEDDVPRPHLRSQSSAAAFGTGAS